MLENMKQSAKFPIFVKTRVAEIENKYSKIDREWLILHFKMAVSFSIAAFFVESLLSLYVSQTSLVTTTLLRFYLKYLILPTVANMLLLFICALLMKNQQVSQTQRIYIVSFTTTLISFVLTTTHNIFTPIYITYLIPIVLTVIYTVPRLTSTISISSLALFFLSEFVLIWDPNKETIFESPIRLTEIILLFVIMLIFSIICIISVRFLQQKNSASIELEMERLTLEHQLRFDELTGIYNRSGLNAALESIEESNGEDSYILAVGDIDYFKKINDRYGHHTGDMCLKAYAETLKKVAKNCMVFRFGGDEFCLLFQNISMDEARAVCTEIQKEVRDFQISDTIVLSLTTSFGLAKYNPDAGVTELFIRADYALYSAKKERNKVVIFQADH